MTKRIKVRADDVKRLVDTLAQEAIEEANEHCHALDGLRTEMRALINENQRLRDDLAQLRLRYEYAGAVDNG